MKNMIKMIAVTVIIGVMAFEASYAGTSGEKFVNRIEKKQGHLIDIAQNREDLREAIAKVSFTTTPADVSGEKFLTRIEKKQAALVSMQFDRNAFAQVLGKPLVSDAKFADRLEYKVNAIGTK